MKYPSRRSMTRGMPSSIQNWVLPGFQYSRLLASASSLLENPSWAAAAETALPSSAMPTSAGHRLQGSSRENTNSAYQNKGSRFPYRNSHAPCPGAVTSGYGHVNHA